jgi:hypothetical protein
MRSPPRTPSTRRHLGGTLLISEEVPKSSAASAASAVNALRLQPRRTRGGNQHPKCRGTPGRGCSSMRSPPRTPRTRRHLGGTLLISEEVPQVLCGLRGLCGECLEAAAATNSWWQSNTSKVQRNASRGCSSTRSPPRTPSTRRHLGETAVDICGGTGWVFGTISATHWSRLHGVGASCALHLLQHARPCAGAQMEPSLLT